MPSHGRYVGRVEHAVLRVQAASRATGSGSTGGCPVLQGKRAVRHALFDTNYWKTFVHARLAVPMGDPGCLSLFGGSQDAPAVRRAPDGRVPREDGGPRPDGGRVEAAAAGPRQPLARLPGRLRGRRVDAGSGALRNGSEAGSVARAVAASPSCKGGGGERHGAGGSWRTARTRMPEVRLQSLRGGLHAARRSAARSSDAASAGTAAAASQRGNARSAGEAATASWFGEASSYNHGRTRSCRRANNAQERRDGRTRYARKRPEGPATARSPARSAGSPSRIPPGRPTTGRPSRPSRRKTGMSGDARALVEA